jgi:hypothetical protein
MQVTGREEGKEQGKQDMSGEAGLAQNTGQGLPAPVPPHVQQHLGSLPHSLTAEWGQPETRWRITQGPLGGKCVLA